MSYESTFIILSTDFHYHSDNAKSFVSSATQSFIKGFGLKWQFVSKHYAQANSRVERVNRFLKQLIKKMNPTFQDWHLFVYQALSIYNNTTNEDHIM